MKKYIPLIAAVMIIIALIAFLQSKKSGTAPRGTDASIIPAPSPTSTSTGATSPEALKKIIDEKSKKYSRVRELVDPKGFVNSDPFHIADYVGKKVILVDFWTYSCINCQRTLPFLTGWYDKYEGDGFVIIGVHSPEFEFEKNYDNVKAATQKYGIKYPVVLDSNMGTWNAYGNRFWPEHYLIDIDGFIVEKHIGEGGYADTEKKIQELLAEKKARLGETGTVRTDVLNLNTKIDTNSPETYFGWLRNEYLENGTQQRAGEQALALPTSFKTNALYLDGTWNFDGEFATNKTPGKIVYRYNAMKVYIVASSPTPMNIIIKKDGVVVKTVTVSRADLYPLIEDTEAGQHLLEIDIDNPGLQAFTFTFG